MMVRRAGSAAGLLAAAAGVALCAASLLAGLAVYGRAVAEAGVRTAVASADPADRSILVRGTPGGDPAVPARWDAALRAAFGTRLSRPADVRAAGYSAGWAFQRPGGRVTADPAYASVMHLEGLAAHARLTAGAWPVAGGAPPQTALAESVAAALGVRPGDRVPIVDRRTGVVVPLTVAGVWRPDDPADAYWRLAPDVFTGVAPQSATYGPLVVERADFDRRFRASASAAWLVEPDLTTATRAQVARVAAEATAIGSGLPAPSGLEQSAAAETGLPGLVLRLARAELVGRSALVTPMLLVTVLGAYALMLVAALLAEYRRGETALLRARGAARGQLAGLAVREALLVVLPAALLAAPLAAGLVTIAGRVPMLSRHVDLQPRLDPVVWLVALAAAAGCALAVAAPALRRGRTYTAELAQRSRPATRAVVQRIGLDLVLAALAVLGWLQLRQYASPLSGGTAFSVDPLLAAAPTLGVVAGAVLSLRLLPPAARLAGRLVDRRAGSAAVLGTWQAGRRAHAGPMVLVALAVAAGTVSWCLAGTAERSVEDQVDRQAAADLRLTEISGSAPPGRAGRLAALPGVTTVLPAWRHRVPLGSDGGTGDLVAVDVERAAGFVPVRDDVAGGDPARLFAGLSGRRDRPATDPVPVAVTPAALAGLHLRVGQTTTLTMAGDPVAVVVTGTMAAVPGTDGGPALLADLPTLTAHVQATGARVPAPQEWWLETTSRGHAGAAAAPAGLGDVRVTDRVALRDVAGRDPFGVGARVALFGAALGALLLAAAGVAVDVLATTRRRAAELAVLHTLGAGPRLLARSLLVEQAFLAGIGALAGLGAGVLVAAAMAPLVVLTPSATRPVPVPLPQIDWPRSAGTALLLVAVALGLSALAAVTMRRGLVAARARIGSDR